jgi:hypothetical protein
MEELTKILKLKDVTRTAAAQYKRILKAHLLVIDDIMMFLVTQQDGVAFFSLINELHDRTSLIITSNKTPQQWADVPKDDVLTTALLDRILYRCEIIKLSSKSYRVEHRKIIFATKKINLNWTQNHTSLFSIFNTSLIAENRTHLFSGNIKLSKEYFWLVLNRLIFKLFLKNNHYKIQYPTKLNLIIA